MGLKKRLQHYLNYQLEESRKDVTWAMSRDKKAAETANELMQESIWLTLGKGFLFIGLVMFLMRFLTGLQFAGVVYLFVGWKVAVYSDYGFLDWEAWVAVFLWLPVVVAGLLKKVVL